MLREAIHLTDAQQVEVLRAFLKHRDKGKFKTQCTYYRAENDLVAEAERQLKGLPEEYLAQAVAAIRKGRYGKESLAQGKQPGPTFLALLQSLNDADAGTQHDRCSHGEFQVIGEELKPESIDVIRTDPSYGKDWLPEFRRHNGGGVVEGTAHSASSWCGPPCGRQPTGSVHRHRAHAPP